MKLFLIKIFLVETVQLKEPKSLSGDILKYTHFEEDILNLKQLYLIKEFLLEAHDIETLVLFSKPQPIKDIAQEFLDLQLNKVIITQLMKWQIRDLFNGNILSLVYMETSELKADLKELLNKSLNRWHLKKIVFISQNNILESHQASSDLLKWLNREGYWNSFLMDLQGNTLAMDHFSQTLFENTLSLQDFMHLKISWSDLRGFPVHISIANNPPRSLVYRNEYNQVMLKGYYGSVLSIFAHIYNASLVIHEISDFDYYNELDCLKSLHEMDIDVCADGMDWNLHDAVTNPEELSGSYLVVPYDKPLPRFQYFIKPFQTSLWILLLIALLYNILALSIIHRIQHKSWLITFHLQYAISSLINLAVVLKRVKGFRRKYLELLLLLKGFIVSNWYLSLLTSLLYTRLYSNDINSLEDLERLNISIMVNEFEFALLNITDVDPIIRKQLLIVPNEVLHENRRNLNPKYAYYSQYDTNNFYLYQQKFLLRPRMKELREVPINPVLAGTAMRANWPFEHLLNNIYGLLMESGLYQCLLDALNEDGIRLGYLTYFPTEYHYVEPLNLEYFQLPAWILAGGCSLGVLSFITEFFWFKRIERE
ncbi:uncharacterized protein ACRADG_008856 [Cochliomyia hominivorax]